MKWNCFRLREFQRPTLSRQQKVSAEILFSEPELEIATDMPMVVCTGKKVMIIAKKSSSIGAGRKVIIVQLYASLE